MGIFQRLAFGWRLGMTSLGVVSRDKTLMLFPVLSGLASLLLVAAFLFGIGPERLAALADAAATAADGSQQVPAVFYVVAFAAYFSLYFITVYFNVALLGAARQSLAGKDTTLGDGLAVANAHLGKILGWTLISASIGILLNMLESNEKIGRFVAAILGTGWTIISYFAVPVMIFEGQSPPAAIGRSAGLMKATWGQNVGAQFGIGLAMVAMLAACAVPVLVLLFVLPEVGALLLPLLLLAVPLVLLLGSAAKSVLAVGLYEYATQHPTGTVFKQEELQAAFR